MLVEFFIAWKFGWKMTLVILIFFEILTLFIIRENLTLNVVILISPIEAIKMW